MKKNISLAVALFTSLIVSACVTVPQEKQVNKNQLAISSVRDIPISYSPGSLFSLAPKYVKETSLKPEQTQAAYELYANAIIADLKSHGFKNTDDASNSVFHVGFGIALASDLSDKTINDKFGITPGLPSNDELRKGSFLIYIEDVLTGKKVWRGAVQGFAHEDKSEIEREQRTAIIVSRVMKQFYATN
ncbi:DUF4136 domain-containing protein [Colwellia psychrerythraea]|uniref:Putative lipoprotein n=1 Tax=Colwellia psychrerythraea (strain 34H / ATCC BAA-681) TaxID=167879 RepID=Q487P9_COLP3|nr:DUF4136 domain-containing protein [Colwellia psychrerythraea]AAZ24727.1 putative lipoprotein [Colwellia psychrerythraea 34H]